MKDGHQKFADDVAKQFSERLASPELRQFFDETKSAADATTGTFEVVITTENLDRYQEVIKLDGWDLGHYRANPVVLWGHDHSKPIGVATSVDIADGKMVAKGKFAPTAFAQEIRQLYDAGIIRATSVGFIEKEREGNLITKSELLEFSFVSVPASPYALSLAMEKALSIDGLVTKGFMFVQKTVSGSQDGEQPEDGAGVGDAPETPSEEPTEPQERRFATKQLTRVIDGLKAAIVALEALGTTEEPEGDDEPEASAEEMRGFLTYRENRKLLQDVATVLGDALAEARSQAEAGRK